MTQSQKDWHVAIALWAVGVMVILIIVWGISEALAYDMPRDCNPAPFVVSSGC